MIKKWIYIYLFLRVSPITLHGFPITIEKSGISPLTTAPAPIIQCSPMLDPGNIIAPAPMKELVPIFTGLNAILL